MEANLIKAKPSPENLHFKIMWPRQEILLEVIHYSGGDSMQAKMCISADPKPFISPWFLSVSKLASPATC